MLEPSEVSVRDVIASLGGASAVAEGLCLGPNGVRRVRGWIEYDAIPGVYWLDLETFAGRAGVALTVASLRDIERVLAAKRAARRTAERDTGKAA